MIKLLESYAPEKNVMIDIESLGVKPGCTILSIGACTFDLKHTFYVKIDPLISRIAGFTENPATKQWWATQTPEARDEAFSGTTIIHDALGQLSQFLAPLDVRGVWGNGADFDIPMLNEAYDICEMARPWGHRDSRCFRTLKNLFDVKEPKFSGEKHNALADALHQAKWAHEIFTKLKGD